MSLKKLLISFVLISTISLAQSIHPINLGFEDSPNGSVPIGWKVPDNLKKTGFIIKTLQAKGLVQGNKCLELYRDVKVDTTKVQELRGSAVQSVNAVNLRNKRIRISAVVKTEVTDEYSYGFLFARAKNSDESTGAYATEGKIRSKEWQAVQLVYDVPYNAIVLNFGVGLEGRGYLNADAFEFKVEDISEIPRNKELSLSDEQLDNLVSFSKVYSNLAFFYPSEEMEYLSHEKFLLEGIGVSIQNKDFLSNMQNYIYNFAPLAKLSKKEVNSKRQLIDTADKFPTVAWQHNSIHSKINSEFFMSRVVNTLASQFPREGVALQAIDATLYKGRKLELKYKVKTNLIGEGSQAQIWTRIDIAPKDTTAKDSSINTTMVKNPIRVKEWTELSLDIDVPFDAKLLRIGAVLIGAGDAWFDDFKLIDKEDGKQYNFNNDDCDSFRDSTTLKNWNVATSVKTAGYKIEPDFIDKSQGIASLRIESPKNNLIKFPELNYVNQVKISNNLFLEHPLVLQVANGRTLPIAKDTSKIFKAPNLNFEYIEDKIAAIIYGSAIIRNFFLELNQKDEDLKAFIKAAIEYKGDKKDFVKQVRDMFNNRNDAQLKLYDYANSELYTYPISFELYGDKIIINDAYEENYSSYIGKEVSSVNGIPTSDFIKKYKGQKNYDFLTLRDIIENRFGEKNSIGEVEILNPSKEKLRLKRTLAQGDIVTKKQKVFDKYEGSIYYIDATRADDYSTKALFSKMQQDEAKAVIFDFRGYASISEFFMGYFIEQDLKGYGFNTNYFTYPNKENVSVRSITPTLRMLSKKPICKNIVFLVDERTLGYSECIAAIGKELGIAKIIGRNSAGAPGDAASTHFLGDLFLSFTVANIYFDNKVSSSNKYERVVPHINVEKKYSDKDLILEEALNYLRKNQK
jgi:C-terminal processing protease CtpA/Prc